MPKTKGLRTSRLVIIKLGYKKLDTKKNIISYKKLDTKKSILGYKKEYSWLQKIRYKKDIIRYKEK